MSHIRSRSLHILLGAAGFLLLCTTAHALEYPIGKPKHVAGMEVAAVYLQPVTMEPAGMMRKASQSDIHLEADIHALADNPNGFPEGAWVPYLPIEYKLTRVDNNSTTSGELVPMIANDGPHYGANVKLFGPGKYKLTLSLKPPSANEHCPFGRHTDRLTGVAPWFKPFSLEYRFVYAGVGKKGGY